MSPRRDSHKKSIKEHVNIAHEGRELEAIQYLLGEKVGGVIKTVGVPLQSYYVAI